MNFQLTIEPFHLVAEEIHIYLIIEDKINDLIKNQKGNTEIEFMSVIRIAPTQYHSPVKRYTTKISRFLVSIEIDYPSFLNGDKVYRYLMIKDVF